MIKHWHCWFNSFQGKLLSKRSQEQWNLCPCPLDFPVWWLQRKCVWKMLIPSSGSINPIRKGLMPVASQTCHPESSDRPGVVTATRWQDMWEAEKIGAGGAMWSVTFVLGKQLPNCWTHLQFRQGRRCDSSPLLLKPAIAGPWFWTTSATDWEKQSKRHVYPVSNRRPGNSMAITWANVGIIVYKVIQSLSTQVQEVILAALAA